jgi:protein FRA10AC1
MDTRGSGSDWDRHVRLLKNVPEVAARAARAVPATPDIRVTTDKDVLLKEFEFLPERNSDAQSTTWAAQLASRYYARLVKEFALADTSRWRSGQVGLRWRTTDEVVSGKGQFVCGALSCDAVMGLHTYEMPFRYVEHGASKLALVKVKLCGECATKVLHKKAASASASASAPASASASAHAAAAAAEPTAVSAIPSSSSAEAPVATATSSGHKRKRASERPDDNSSSSGGSSDSSSGSNSDSDSGEASADERTRSSSKRMKHERHSKRRRKAKRSRSRSRSSSRSASSSSR